MALILDLVWQAVQMLLVVAIAPLVLGVTRKVKARLMRRRGPPLLQPYSDLWKLLHKEAVLATNASWLYRTAPYVIFAATWVAAALVPTYATGLLFSWSADLIAIVALIGTGRFALALAGMDVGTSFGGIGSSREMLIASLAEPVMLLVVFTVALLAGEPGVGKSTMLLEAGALASPLLRRVVLDLEGINGAYTAKSVNEAFKNVKDFKTDILCKPWYYGQAALHIPNNTDRTVTPQGGHMVQKEGCFAISDVDPGIAQVRKIEAGQ